MTPEKNQIREVKLCPIDNCFAGASQYEGKILTENGVIIEINEVVEKILGHKRDEVIGRPLLDFASDENREHIRKKMQEKYTGEYEIIGNRKNGTLFICKIYSESVLYQGRQMRLATFIDISQLKQAEQELKEKTALLLKASSSLSDKEIAIHELLIQMEKKQEKTRLHFLVNMEKVALPLIDRIEKNAPPELKKDLNLLKSSLQNITSPLITNLLNLNVKLSPQQIKICYLIRNGASTREIARELNITPQTVFTHRKLIRKKLGLDGQSKNLVIFLKNLDFS